MSKENPLVGSAVKASAFAKEKASASLRVCCFGSSSSETPAAYLRPSAEVGYLLAVRGHVCVNGAGSFGCMAAMNEGAVLGNGHIVGVIHEMWLVDGPEDTRRQQWGLQRPLRDSGAHAAFSSTQKGGDSPLALSSGGSPEGPIRELLVAGGKDLQERKKLLVEKADGLIVMPGGPGTFDELLEMVCARNIGLSSIPIVCVNIDGFYDPFHQMLVRAWEDRLTKLRPEQLVHFADTAEEAIRWVEEVHTLPEAQTPSLRERGGKEVMRTASVLDIPAFLKKASFGMLGADSVLEEGSLANVVGISCIFALGFAAGSLLSKRS